MRIEKDYCDYDTCVALEELGFREPTLTHYMENYPNNLIYHYHDNACVKDCYRRVSSRNGVFGAPTLYDAQKWLRGEKKIDIFVRAGYLGKNRVRHYYVEVFTSKDVIYLDNDSKDYDSYEEALLEGVRASIKLLKEEK